MYMGQDTFLVTRLVKFHLGLKIMERAGYKGIKEEVFPQQAQDLKSCEEKVDNVPVIDELGFRSIIDLLPCYISIQDRSMHVQFANERVKADFGDAIGRLCHEVYKGSLERCISCPVQKTFDDKLIHLSEETVILTDGKAAQMIVYSAPIFDISGEVKAVIEMGTNISKVKEMQKELKLLGQSFAVLSHDIKNILEGLQGGAYVVDEAIKDRDMELAGRGWEIVRRNIAEITSLAQDVLFSSKDRGLKFEKLSPNEIVRDVVALFQEKAKSFTIKLNYQTNPALPLVNLDPLNIKRMLRNFINNAFEACVIDKQDVSHFVIVRTDFHDKSHIKFEVEDNGVGMDEETAKEVFEEFYSTKGSSGTGLGLCVANKIVKKHGGKVEILTAPGKGSTFRSIIPIK